MRRVISFFLACTLMFSMTVTAFAAEEIPTMSAEEFEKLPEDTIVCYMFGQPVYKYEVDDNFIVHKDFSDGAILPPNNAAAAGTEENYKMYYEEDAIPAAHRGEMIYVEGHLVAPRFGQNDKFTYFPLEDAVNLAQELESASGDISTLATLVGWIPIAGTFVGTIIGMSALGKSQLASQIRKCTDEDYGVIVVMSSSNYGSFRAAHRWDGTNCIRYPGLQSSTVSTVYVDSVICECNEDLW